jgi:hypothetical protein
LTAVIADRSRSCPGSGNPATQRALGRRIDAAPRGIGNWQLQIYCAAGPTFARSLRNILRHDPDVPMVGEIHDQESAEIAIGAHRRS